MEAKVDDEISLIDVYDFLKDGWKLLLSFVLIGISVGVVMSSSPSKQFEAKGLIRGASVGDLNSMKRDVESIGTLVAKIQSYYDRGMLDFCLSESEAENLEVITKELNVKADSDLDVVASVVYRASSREKALGCLEQILEVVVENQKDLVSPFLTEISLNLDKRKRVVDELQSSIKKLESYKTTQEKKTNNDSDYWNVVELTAGIYELKRLLMVSEAELYELERMVLPPITQEANFVTPIYLVEHRASPRRASIVITSAIVSLCCGIFTLLLRRAYRRLKMQLEERHK